MWYGKSGEHGEWGRKAALRMVVVNGERREGARGGDKQMIGWAQHDAPLSFQLEKQKCSRLGCWPVNKCVGVSEVMHWRHSACANVQTVDDARVERMQN